MKTEDFLMFAHLLRMNVDVSVDFTSCGCSKTPHSLDWSADEFIAFGSSQNVCLLKTENENSAAQIVGTFCNHKSNVTVVKYVKDSRTVANDLLLLSGSSDCTCVIWRQNGDQLKAIAKFVGHSMAVNFVCGIFNEASNCVHIFTCSADSSLRVWKFSLKEDFENVQEVKESQQSLTFGSGFSLCADCVSFFSGSVLLAVGNDDNKIRLYYQENVSKEFSLVLILTGHEDWIRCLSFSHSGKDDDFMLASCSQDTYVRLWGVRRLAANFSHENVSNLKIDEEIKVRGRIFNVETEGVTRTYEVKLDAVLASHDSWVYSVTWNPTGSSQILTASMDKSLIIWEPESDSGVWLPKVHLGEVGGQYAGFYGAKFKSNGNAIVAHSFVGGLHSWNLCSNESWKPAVISTGHFSSAEDISWDPSGNFLLSCSQDQTARLFAPWVRKGKKLTYHEISRPQVHGHDLQCLSAVTSCCFVSGAEEKIIRAFVAPKSFAQHLRAICGLSESDISKYLPAENLAEGASLPSLGLSNKAIFLCDDANINENDENRLDEGSQEKSLSFHPNAELKQPPTEDYLSQNTLWPEVYKLKADHAKVILWSSIDWKQGCQLEGHSLTVTQIEFSPNDKFLLTVSRDRSWCLYRRENDEDEFSFMKVGCIDKKTSIHTRIIWSCGWTFDSKYFFTVSRDKKIAVWKIEETVNDSNLGIVSMPCQPFETEDSTTAVSSAPAFVLNGRYLLSIGLECGKICILTWDPVATKFDQLTNIRNAFAHALSVKRLRFRPQVGVMGEKEKKQDHFQLASCSEDNSVKIFRITVS